MSKRIVCALLTLILLVGLIPVNAIPAFAADTGMTGAVTNTDEVNVRKAPGVRSELATTLKRGAKVTVYETTVKDNAVWGRIDEGWIYMFYVQLNKLPTPGADSSAIGKVIATGTVNSNVNLNVRDGAGLEHTLQTSLPKGTRLNIYEKKTVNGAQWGRIDTNSWVCLMYVSLDSSVQLPNADKPEAGQPETSTPADGRKAKVVNCNPGVNVRTGAGVHNALIGNIPVNSTVTYFEESTVNGVRWVRTDKGWICTQYLQDLEAPKPEGSKPGKPDGNKPGKPGVSVGEIINTSEVNVRDGAGMDAHVIGTLKGGTKVNVYETKTVGTATWGRIDQGWVYMFYVKLLPTIEGDLPSGNNDAHATGIVVSKVNLNVRTGAGIGYQAVSSLKPGSRINIYEQTMKDGMSWGRTDGGWVCLAYVTIESTGNSGVGEMGTVVRCYSAVNVRSGPSTGHALVGTIAVNSRVEILEQTNYNGKMWGRVRQGWVSMDYILLDSELPNPPMPEGEGAKPIVPDTPVAPEDSDLVPYYIGCIVDLSSGLKIRSSATSNTDNIVGELRNGVIVQLKGLKQVGDKLWGKIDGGWIDLTYVKYNTEAIVRANELAARKVPTSYADKTGVVKKDQMVTITGLALENGKKVWGKVAAGWIELDGVEIGGKAGDPVNTNPAVAFTGYGENKANAKVRVQAISAAKAIADLTASEKRTFLAVKADMADPLKTWARIEVNGVAGWILLDDVTVKMPTLVKEDMVAVRKAADADATIIKYLNKNDNATVTDLRVSGNTVWGEAAGGWVRMDSLIIDGKLDVHVNRNPEAPLNATLKAAKAQTGRVDAFGTAEAVATLAAGDFDIHAVKADDTAADTFWVKTVIAGVPQWIQLSSDITVNFQALVVAPNATLYDSYKAGAKPAVVVNKNEEVTVTGLAAVGSVAWGKTPGGWINMSFVQVGGKAPVPSNKNPEISVKIPAAIPSANTPAYAEAHASTTQLKTLAVGTMLDLYALKADADDASKLWAAAMVDGVPCWVKVEQLQISSEAIVRPESIQRYAAPGASSNMAGKAAHNDIVKIVALAIADGKAWGKDSNNSTWIAMENVEVGGKPTAWPNNNPLVKFEGTINLTVAATGYETPSSLSIPVGAAGNVAAGDHKVNGLKLEGTDLWAQVLDEYGNTSWIKLVPGQYAIAATAKGKNKCILREKAAGNGKQLAIIPDGTAFTIGVLTVVGQEVWGSASYDSQNGWVNTAFVTK